MQSQDNWKQQTARALALVVAFAGITGSAPVRAEEPLACTTSSAFPDAKGAGRYTITATAPFSTPCADGSECTGMTYVVQPNSYYTPDHVVIQVAADVEVDGLTSCTLAGTCDKDTRTGVGGDCHMQTLRLNPAADKKTFQLVVRGNQDVVPSTVYVNKGKVLEACRIASLGTEPALDEFQSVAESTTLAFKGCKVIIPKSTSDGVPGVATFAEDSDPACAFVANAEPLANLSLQVNGMPVGDTKFATDFEAGSGDDSCSTQVIRGRVYSFCTCADTNGDGLPDDPRPPCR
jgi:hypothetical protein